MGQTIREGGKTGMTNDGVKQEKEGKTVEIDLLELTCIAN